ncbi:MAG: sterol desaturase family protein [Bacteroidetes bacterium]|nr:sterol desaturase family protein [Bacteroidota bacterium]
MKWYIFLLIVFAAFAAMEAVAWLTHRYVMHGFLWNLHKDHHQPTGKGIEKNDSFFLIFAVPCWLSIQFGLMYHIQWLAAIGFGIGLYGFAYFIVHEIIIHQRIKIFSRSNNIYIRAIRWAHKMHHKHPGKEHGESFGMLIVAAKYWKKVKDDRKRIIAESV